MIDRRLAMASLDPNAAIAAIQAQQPQEIVIHVAPSVAEEAPYEELMFSIEAPPRRELSWWRFAMFWILLRLAARVVRFKFEIHHEER